MIAECKDNTVMQDTDNKSPELIKWHLNLKQIQLTLRRDKTCLCCSWRAVRADTRHASRVIRYRQEIETQIANCYDILHILCRCRVDCDIVCDHKTKGNSGLLSHRMRVQYLFFSFWVRAGRSRPLVYITVTIVKIVTRNKLNVPEFNCPWPILLFPCGMCGRCKSLNYVEFHVRLQNIRILNCVFLILRLHYHTCCWKE